jgi:hypothetical protein
MESNDDIVKQIHNLSNNKFLGLPDYLVMLGYFLDNEDKYDQQLLEYKSPVDVWENSTSDDPKPSPGIVVEAISRYNKLRDDSFRAYVSLIEIHGIAAIERAIDDPESFKAEHSKASIFLNDQIVVIRKVQPNTAISLLNDGLKKIEPYWKKTKAHENKHTTLRELEKLVQSLDTTLSDDPEYYHPLVLKHKEQLRPKYQAYHNAISRDIDELKKTLDPVDALAPATETPADAGKGGLVEESFEGYVNEEFREAMLPYLMSTYKNSKPRHIWQMLVATTDCSIIAPHILNKTDEELLALLVPVFGTIGNGDRRSFNSAKNTYMKPNDKQKADIQLVKEKIKTICDSKNV